MFAFTILIDTIAFERGPTLPKLVLFTIFAAVPGLGGYAGSVAAAYLWQVFKRNRKRAR